MIDQLSELRGTAFKAEVHMAHPAVESPFLPAKNRAGWLGSCLCELSLDGEDGIGP